MERGEDTGPGIPPSRKKVWAGGFSRAFRRWFQEELGPELGVETRAFSTGEDVLAGLSQALLENYPPELIILDLRLPMINGINVAIAARAFELGYNRSDRIPIIFLFEPPVSSSFDKVIKFCQPLRMVQPGEDEESIQYITREIAYKISQI